MVPVFLCLEDVFNVMWQWWSFIAYYIPRTCSSQIGENILGKTPQTYRNVIYGIIKVKKYFAHKKCDFNKLILNKIFYLVVFSCINLPLTAKDTSEQFIAK